MLLRLHYQALDGRSISVRGSRQHEVVERTPSEVEQGILAPTARQPDVQRQQRQRIFGQHRMGLLGNGCNRPGHGVRREQVGSGNISCAKTTRFLPRRCFSPFGGSVDGFRLKEGFGCLFHDGRIMTNVMAKVISPTMPPIEMKSQTCYGVTCPQWSRPSAPRDRPASSGGRQFVCGRLRVPSR